MLQWTKKAPGYWIAERRYSAGYASLFVASRRVVEQSGAQWPHPDTDGYMGGGEIILSATRSALACKIAGMREAFYTVFAAQGGAECWAEESEEYFVDAQRIILFDEPTRDAQQFVGLLGHNHGFRMINGSPIGMISRIDNFLALVTGDGLTYYTLPSELDLPKEYNPGEIKGMSVEFGVVYSNDLGDDEGEDEDDGIPF